MLKMLFSINLILFMMCGIVNGDESQKLNYTVGNGYVRVDDADELLIKMKYASYPLKYKFGKDQAEFLKTLSEDDKMNSAEWLVLNHFLARKKGDISKLLKLYEKSMQENVIAGYSKIKEYPKALKKYDDIEFVGKTYFGNMVRVRTNMVSKSSKDFLPMVQYIRVGELRSYIVDNISNHSIIEDYTSYHPVNNGVLKPIVVDSDQIKKLDKVNYQFLKEEIKLNINQDSRLPSDYPEITIAFKLNLVGKGEKTHKAETDFFYKVINLIKEKNKKELKALYLPIDQSLFKFFKRSNPIINQLCKKYDTDNFKLELALFSKSSSTFYTLHDLTNSKKISGLCIYKSKKSMHLVSRGGDSWYKNISTSPFFFKVVESYLSGDRK